MCLVGHLPRPKRNEVTMSWDLFQRILRDIAPGSRVNLQGLGEPLVVPWLDDAIRVASERQLCVGLVTNGTLLTRSRALRLIDAGLQWIDVSIDSPSEQTYRRLRPGARLEPVLRNLATMVEENEKSGGLVAIRVICVLQQANVLELVELVEMVVDAGVKRLWLQGVAHDFSDVLNDPTYADISAHSRAIRITDDVPGFDQFSAAIVAAAERAELLGLDLRIPNLTRHKKPRGHGIPRCSEPFNNMYIRHDGVVQVCCMLMGTDRADMGRIGDEPLSTVWRNDRFSGFREQLMTDQAPEVCEGCSLYEGTL